MPYLPLIVVGGLIVVVIVLISMILQLYKAAPPNYALVVWGRGGFRCIVGGGTIVWPVVQKSEMMYTGLRTLPVDVSHVYTIEGVPISVETVVQFKISHEDDQIRNAAYRFLGKSPEDIDDAMTKTLDGHLRTIIATLTANQVYQDQASFAEKVVNLSGTDMNPLGLTIDSFVIKRISDEQGYYDSLGAKQVALVKQEAAVAKAESDRITRERQAQEALAARQAEIIAQTREAAADRDRNVQQAEFKKTADTATAEADMAYELKKAEISRQLAETAGAAEVERQRQAAAAATQAIEVARQRQQADTVVPAAAAREATVQQASADAEARRLRATAEADATKVTAEAEAQRIRATRSAEAAGVEATGLATAKAEEARLFAQASGEQKLAEARSAQGQVNLRKELTQMMFDAQVRIADASSRAMAGLGQNMRIVQFSNGKDGQGGNALLNALGGVPDFMSQMNARVTSLTGVDLGGWFDGLNQSVRGKPGALSNLTHAGDQSSNGGPPPSSPTVEPATPVSAPAEATHDAGETREPTPGPV